MFISHSLSVSIIMNNNFTVNDTIVYSKYIMNDARDQINVIMRSYNSQFIQVNGSFVSICRSHQCQYYPINRDINKYPWKQHLDRQILSTFFIIIPDNLNRPAWFRIIQCPSTALTSFADPQRSYPETTRRTHAWGTSPPQEKIERN